LKLEANWHRARRIGRRYKQRYREVWMVKAKRSSRLKAKFATDALSHKKELKAERWQHRSCADEKVRRLEGEKR